MQAGIFLPPVFACSDETFFDESDFGLISEYLVEADKININSTENDEKFRAKASVSDFDDGAANKKQRVDTQQERETEIKRERSRALARKARLRKKLYFEALQRQMAQLVKEREYLRDVIKTKISSDIRQQILSQLPNDVPRIITSSVREATSLLGRNDYHLMTAIQTAQRSFCITNPFLPDNPIVFASEGFLELTGYTRDQVLGRNCRFLQGPGTDQKKVAALGKGIADGVDTSVCLLNYRADGTSFYNQIFLAALRNVDNVIVNYVGVQVECEKPQKEKE
eukprot:gene3776-7499_t